MAGGIKCVQKYHTTQKIEESNYAIIYKIQVKKKPLVLKIAQKGDPEYNDLISREFQVLSQFKHPNIVSVLEYDVSDDNRAYFTMEYLPDKPINKHFTGYSEEFLAALAQVLNGLGAFHDKGFIHSDLKPEHIVYSKDKKKAVLIDFGFAQQRLGEEGIDTKELKLAGTIGYIAPEVLKGIGVDQRSDLYSLGVIVHEIISGEKLRDPYVPIKNIPEDINTMIFRLVSREPALRPSIPELYQTLSKHLKKVRLEIPSYKVTLPQTGFVEPTDIVEKLSSTKGTVLVVTGDSGAGKTRLLQEMKYRYLMQDYAVLLYLSSEKTTFADVLQRFTKMKKVDVSDRENKFQIFEEMNEALLNYAEDKNVVIMVDDLDTLSDYELGLFRYIGHGIKDTSVLLIGTSSDLSGEGQDEKISILGFEILRLKPLSVDEIEKLMKRTFFRIKPTKARQLTDFTAWLHQQSGGNPLFIVEILKTLFEKNIAYYKGHGWNLKMNALGRIKIPQQLETLVDRRLNRLSDEEMKTLKILALADCPLASSVLTSISKSRMSVVIEHLKNIGLVQENISNTKRSLRISNQILARKIEKMFSKKDKEFLSKTVLRVIENFAPDDKIYWPLLARLSEEIGETKKAYNYLRKLAEHRESIHDYNSAGEYYRKILAHEKINSTRYYETLIKIAHLSHITGNHKLALQFYKKAMRTKTKELLSDVYSGMAYVHSATGKYKEAVRLLDKAASLIDKKQTPKYLKLENRYAYSLMSLNKFSEAENILKKSTALARDIGDIKLVTETLYYRATLEWCKKNFAKGIEYASKELMLAQNHNLQKHYAYAASILCLLYQQKGDIDSAQKYQKHAISAFREMRMSNAIVHAFQIQAGLKAIKGDYAEAKKLFEDALIRARQIDSQKLICTSLSNLASISENTANFDEAIQYNEKALHIEHTRAIPTYNLAMLYYKKGDLNKSKSILKKALNNEEMPLYYIGLAMVYLSLGKDKHAEDMLSKALHKITEQNLHIAAKIDAFLWTSFFYYEKANFDKSITYAAKIMQLSAQTSREHFIARALSKINNFALRKSATIDTTQEAKALKKMGCIYDYAHIERVLLEALNRETLKTPKIGEVVQKLQDICSIFNALDAKLELKRIKMIQEKLFPIICKEYSKRAISEQYLDTLSALANLISNALGDESFIKKTLDLLIDATRAERGAVFINTPKGMEFSTGRDMDHATIKDAGELSQSVIQELEKNRIVFTQDALADPKFSIKKSVMLNQIRSLLCIPLSVAGNVIGAIYLDSKIASGIFGPQDKDFLFTVSKILASVIEKSMAFQTMAEENILLKNNIIKDIGSGYLMGTSRAMKRIYSVIESVAETNSPVLILGETGTGKGMIARLIHMKSTRRDKKFLTINCGTIPETLLESELFGHKKGAFTGAISDKQGLLEAAQGGTVFLDEITNTNPSFQAKILEAIEEKIIRRIGETKTRNIDVRFLFATNKDLESEVEMGKFRKDLFYRINVFSTEIPPLRERTRDIPLLAQFFLKRHSDEMNKKVNGFEPDAMKKMKEYLWPGNVRELQNVIERAVVLTKSPLITIDDLGLERFKKPELMPLADIKKEAIIDALNLTNWNIKQAANALHINRRTIERYIKTYNIVKQS